MRRIAVIWVGGGYLRATFAAYRWGPLVWVQKSWIFAGGCFVWGFFLAKPQARGVQKSGTLRFLAVDLFAKVVGKIWLSKKLEQDTIVRDCGGGSEEFFWPLEGRYPWHLFPSKKKGIQNVFFEAAIDCI